MKRYTAALWLAGMLWASSASAAEVSGWYAAPRLTGMVQHSEMSASALGRSWGPKSVLAARAGGALAVGYDFQPGFRLPVRLELEYGAFDHVSRERRLRIQRRPLPFRVKVGTQTLLANVCVDIPLGGSFTPYLALGAGAAFLRSSLTVAGQSDHRSEAVAAGHAGFGCSYAFSPQLTVELGYRFLRMASADYPAAYGELNLRENLVHQVMLGLRVSF